MITSYILLSRGLNINGPLSTMMFGPSWVSLINNNQVENVLVELRAL